MTKLKPFLNKQDTKKDELLGELLDSYFTDLWLLCIWFENENVDLSTILNLPSNIIAKHELFENMANWTGIKIRYRDIVEQLYSRLLVQVSQTLQLIEKDLEAMSSSNLRKVYAFCLIARNLLSNTKVYDVIPASLNEASIKYVQSM